MTKKVAICLQFLGKLHEGNDPGFLPVSFDFILRNFKYFISRLKKLLFSNFTFKLALRNRLKISLNNFNCSWNVTVMTIISTLIKPAFPFKYFRIHAYLSRQVEWGCFDIWKPRSVLMVFNFVTNKYKYNRLLI